MVDESVRFRRSSKGKSFISSDLEWSTKQSKPEGEWLDFGGFVSADWAWTVWVRPELAQKCKDCEIDRYWLFWHAERAASSQREMGFEGGLWGMKGWPWVGAPEFLITIKSVGEVIHEA